MLPFFHIVFEEDNPKFLRELRVALEYSNCTLRHPTHRDFAYVICDSRSRATRRSRQIAVDPDCPFDTDGMITIDGNALTIHTPGTPEVQALIAAVLLPLIEQHECQIVDAFGHDQTSNYTGRFHELLAPN